MPNESNWTDYASVLTGVPLSGGIPFAGGGGGGGGGQQQPAQQGAQVPQWGNGMGGGWGGSWGEAPPLSSARAYGGDPAETAGETYSANNAWFFQQPTMTNTYAQGLMGKYGGGGKPTTNRAEEAYQQFQAKQPADIDPYYANARKRAFEDIDRKAASQGMLGSSYALNQTSRAAQDLAAQQAKDEAEYGLNRGNLAGQLGRNADLSSVGSSQNEMGWQSLVGDAASSADQNALSRIMSGYQMAAGAQNQYGQRFNDQFNQQLAQTKALDAMAGNTYDQMIGADQEWMQYAMDPSLASAQNAAMHSGDKKAGLMEDADRTLDMFMKVKGLAGGGGGGGGMF